MTETRSERVVAHRMFEYQTEEGFPKLARNGETVFLNAEDEAFGDKHGALVPKASKAAAPAAPADKPTPADMSDAELAAFVDKSTILQVLTAVGDDPEQAERAITAENTARGGDARSSLLEKLNAVASPEN